MLPRYHSFCPDALQQGRLSHRAVSLPNGRSGNGEQTFPPTLQENPDGIPGSADSSRGEVHRFQAAALHHPAALWTPEDGLLIPGQRL